MIQELKFHRYDKKSDLYDIALERITSLTNASSALIEIVKKSQDNLKQYIIFPAGINPDKILNSRFKIESSFEHNDRIVQFYSF